MRAPRRVPWANKAELAELYEMLFSPSADYSSRQRGVARMGIYISSPSCPWFVHLLHSLVAVELLPRPSGGEETQRTRMMMAMAVVRFVNGMVDPLQTGPYARPISHIAASLGIPPSLIALRHRATHEDLPPLSLLNQAIAQCITYIHHYSFLPLLASASTANPGQAMASRAEEVKLARVESLIGRWKKVVKGRLREKEVREEDESGREVRRVKRELEGEDGEVVAKVLCGIGALVPIAKQKRPSKNALAPTQASLQIWLPLLLHLTESSHQHLPLLLSTQILDNLLLLDVDPQSAPADTETRPSGAESDSARWALATWFLYLWTADLPLALDTVDKEEMWRKVMGSLLEKNEDAILRQLASSLVQVEPTLRGAQLLDFLPPLPSDALEGPEEEDQPELSGLEVDMDDAPLPLSVSDGVEEMERRMAEFERLVQSTREVVSPSLPVDDGLSGHIGQSRGAAQRFTQLQSQSKSVAVDVGGWRKLAEEEWRACPIGVWSGA